MEKEGSRRRRREKGRCLGDVRVLLACTHCTLTGFCSWKCNASVLFLTLALHRTLRCACGWEQIFLKSQGGPVHFYKVSTPGCTAADDDDDMDDDDNDDMQREAGAGMMGDREGLMSVIEADVILDDPEAAAFRAGGGRLDPRLGEDLEEMDRFNAGFSDFYAA
jgi:hypothetical protein